MTERPFVSIDPAMRFGRPCLNHTRIPVEVVADHFLAGDPIDRICADYQLSRGDILIACWYLGQYGDVEYRDRWSAWSSHVAETLWHSTVDYTQVPDPPFSEEHDE